MAEHFVSCGFVGQGWEGVGAANRIPRNTAER